MKINQIADKTLAAVQPYQKPEPAAPEAAKKANAPQTPRDEVALSPEAKEIRQIKAIVSQIPEVRQDVVGDIKSRLASGTYEIDSGRIADKMLKETLLDIFV